MEPPQITRDLQPFFNLGLSRFEESFLCKILEKQMKEAHCDSPRDYGIYLEQNPGEVELLSTYLYIHFSEFFRDPLTSALLERIIIPDLIQKKKSNRQNEIRIWSAGCAAGQEPFSIAILMEEAIQETDQSIKYRIFATDVDDNILSEARFGHYPVEALKNVSLKRVETWFTRQGGDYVIHSSIQQHVDFSRFDLLAEGGNCPPSSIFGEFDLVFCCNLLIYYQPEYRNLVLNKFTNCITQGGYLVTGETERAIAQAHHYNEIFPQAAIFRLNLIPGKTQ